MSCTSVSPYVSYGSVCRFYWSAKKNRVKRKLIPFSEHPTLQGWACAEPDACIFCGNKKLEHVGILEYISPHNDYIIYNKCLECAMKAFPKPLGLSKKAEAAWELYPSLSMELFYKYKLPYGFVCRNWLNRTKLLVKHQWKYSQEKKSKNEKAKTNNKKE